MLSWTAAKSRNIQVSSSAALLILVLLGIYLKTRSTEKNSNKTYLPQFANPFRGIESNTWEFDVGRDDEDYGLSNAQCSAAFAKLYCDVNEMVPRRKTNHTAKADMASVITEHQVSAIRAVIHNGELYIISDDGLAVYQSRGFATLHAINRALLAYPDRARLPNCECRLYIGDLVDQITSNDTLWVSTKRIGSDTNLLWLMPDFGIYDRPEANDRILHQITARHEGHSRASTVGREDVKTRLAGRNGLPKPQRLGTDRARQKAGQIAADVAGSNIKDPDGDGNSCRFLSMDVCG